MSCGVLLGQRTQHCRTIKKKPSTDGGKQEDLFHDACPSKGILVVVHANMAHPC